jgi:hypothetical protein
MLQPVGFGKANKGIPAFGVAFGWIRRRPDGQGNPCKHQIVSGGLIPLPRPFRRLVQRSIAQRLSLPAFPAMSAFSVKSLQLAGVR